MATIGAAWDPPGGDDAHGVDHVGVASSTAYESGDPAGLIEVWLGARDQEGIIDIERRSIGQAEIRDFIKEA